MIERDIENRVRERAGQWFPECGQSPTVRLEQLSSRPRAQLYTVHIGDGPTTQRILAKIRREGHPAANSDGQRGRPTLATDSLSVSELTALEFDGLSSIFEIFPAPDARFSAIRPLDHMADANTILMGYVQAPTLRKVLVNRSRLSPQYRSARHQDVTEVWQRVGAWLRIFHQSMPHRTLPVRQPTREDVVDRFHAYGEFLTTRVGPRALGDVAERGALVAQDGLPAQLPMSVGHGDFAPRNVFLGPDGRLTVFDPMARWVVPNYEDLCRLLVGMRLSGLQLHTRGAAYAQQELERREQGVIKGYYADDVVPRAQLRCYQLLIMLDKWSALIQAGEKRGSARLKRISLTPASGYLGGEARRALGLAESVIGERPETA